MPTIPSTAISIVLMACFSIGNPLYGWGDEKSVGQWIDCLKNDDLTIRNAANETLSAEFHEGTGSLLLDPNDNPISERDRKRRELRPYRELLLKVLACPYDKSRSTAAMLLSLLGPDASVAAPLLWDLIRTKTTSSQLRLNSSIALLHVTPSHQAVGPKLFNSIAAAVDGTADESNARHDQPDVKRRVEEQSAGLSAVWLALLLVQSDRTLTELPTLVELTSQRHRRGIRLIAIATLFELRDDANSAIPTLRKLLVDDDEVIRVIAGQALIRIARDLGELPAVLNALHLNEEEANDFRKRVMLEFDENAQILASFREDSDFFTPFFAAQIKYGYPFFRRQAIRSVKSIGPDAKVFVPDLLTAAKSTNESIKEAAIMALKEIDPLSIPPELKSWSALRPGNSLPLNENLDTALVLGGAVGMLCIVMALSAAARIEKRGKPFFQV